MDILLLYMAGEGGVQPDLKRENVRHVCNFISATPLRKLTLFRGETQQSSLGILPALIVLCSIMSLRANIVRLSCY